MINHNNTDPFDPTGSLPAIADEFAVRPDHEPAREWRPGDSMLTPEALAASQQYFAEKAVADKAADEQQKHEEIAGHRERRIGRRWKRLYRAVAALSLVAAGYNTAAAGDIIDQFGAYKSSGGEVASAALATVDAKYHPAARQIIDIYQTIDRTGMEQVVRDADAYRQQHADQFADHDEIVSAEEAIDAAASLDEVGQAATGFLRQYGVDSVSVMDKVPLGDAKQIAQAAIEVISPLPKDFVQTQTEFHQLVIAPSDLAPELDGTNETGNMLSGVMKIYAQTLTQQTIEASLGMLSSQPLSYPHFIAHELGHAWQFKQKVVAEDYPTTIPNSAGEITTDVLRGIVDRPDMPSTYARHGGLEFGADLMSGLFASGTSSLASPNEWRGFTSSLTRKHMNELAKLETSYPGIALLLITDRSRDP